MGDFDTNMKTIVSAAPQDFVTWLVGEACYQDELSTRFASRNIESDVLLRIEVNGKPCLLHIEFQKRRDSKMAYRLWEYNALATQKYGIPVYSVVIYLKEDNGLANSPYTVEWPSGMPIHRFSFEVIKLWTITAEELFQTGLKGLLPLIPLTRDGDQREKVDRVIRILNAEENQEPYRELLSLTYGFASLIFVDISDQDWLRRRFRMLRDILKDTWAFQELMQEGREEGRKAAVSAEKETLLFYVQTRFPALLPLATQQSALLETSEQVQGLMRAIILSQTEEETRQHLLKANEK